MSQIAILNWSGREEARRRSNRILASIRSFNSSRTCGSLFSALLRALRILGGCIPFAPLAPDSQFFGKNLLTLFGKP
jgi:hypothetical protein